LGTATLSANGCPAQWRPNSHGAMAGGIKRGNDGGRLRRQPPPPPRSGPIVARSDPSASRLPQAGAIGLAQARQRVAITSHAFVLVLTLRKRRTPIYATPGTALPVGSSPDVRSAFRRCEGASPVQRLKACVKALASWKPRSQAMCEIESERLVYHLGRHEALVSTRLGLGLINAPP
jgi:hypothetical protein